MREIIHTSSSTEETGLEGGMLSGRSLSVVLRSLAVEFPESCERNQRVTYLVTDNDPSDSVVTVLSSNFRNTSPFTTTPTCMCWMSVSARWKGGWERATNVIWFWMLLASPLAALL